jgi:uncharacterized membrane protein required for colicin V production
MNPLDILIAGIVGYGLYLGASKGVLKGMTSIVSIGAAVIFGWMLRPRVEAFMVEHESLRFNLEGQGLVFVSFVVAFVLMYIIVNSLLGYGQKLFSALPGGMSLDKALGALVGGFVVTMVLSVFFLVTSTAGFPSQDNARGSVLYPLVRNFGRQVLGTLPQAMSSANEQLRKYTPPPNTDTNGAPAEPNKPKAIR